MKNFLNNSHFLLENIDFFNGENFSETGILKINFNFLQNNQFAKFFNKNTNLNTLAKKYGIRIILDKELVKKEFFKKKLFIQNVELF